QRKGVNRHAPGLAIGRIARMFSDVALYRIDSERANAGRFVGAQVVTGDVESATIGVEPVAGHEFPQRDHVVARQIEGTRADLPGKPTAGRSGDATLVSSVARQEPFSTQDRQRVRGPVALHDAVDEL